MKRVKNIFLFFLIMFFLSFPVIGIYPVKLTADYGYDGYTIPNHWFPLTVRIDRTVQKGRLEIVYMNYDNRLITEIYPADRSNIIECPVYYKTGRNNINIKLYADKTLLNEQNIKFTQKSFPGNLFLTSGIPEFAMNTIEDALLPDERSLVIQIEPFAIPSNALSYEGLKGLIINDIGPVLNPYQTAGIKSYIASGGSLVVFTNKSYEQSFLSHIINKKNFNPGKKESRIRVGRGSMIIVYDDIYNVAWVKSRKIWINKLDIKPYDKETNILSALSYYDKKTVIKDDFYKIHKLKISGIIFLLIFSWGLISVLILLFLKKNKLYVLLSCFAVYLIISFFMGNFSSNIYQKGFIAGHRALLFIETGEMRLISSVIKNNVVRKGADIFKYYSPWGLKIINNNTDTAVFSDFRKNSLIHTSNAPQMQFFDADAESLKFMTSLSINESWQKFLKALIHDGQIMEIVDSEIMENLDHIIRWDGSQYFECSLAGNNGGSWNKLKKLPFWIKDNEAWLNNFYDDNKNYDFIIGYTKLSFFNFKTDNLLNNRVLWVMPFRHVLKEGENQ